MNQLPITRLFYLFLIAHIAIWTILPSLVRLNLPLDAIEGTIWSLEWQWGYDKNPFLNAWLTAFASYLVRDKDWIIYFFSQCSVGLCLWSVWKLANNYLLKPYALLAVILLETLQYFHFHAIDFNDNTLELGLWAITIYCFYLSVTAKTNNYKYYLAWIFTGFFAALALMAKYYTLALLTSMFLFFISHKTTRQQLKTFAPYLSLSIFICILIPHIVWLFSHDFISIRYVLARAESAPHWLNHLFFPIQFTWQQFEVFIPAIIFMIILCFGTTRQKVTIKDVSSVEQRFLYFMALGPLFLTLFLSILFGIKLRAGWGMPLLSLWGILLVQFFRPNLSAVRLSAAFLSVFFLMGSLGSAYSISIIKSETPSSANFPGKQLADFMTETWHQQYGKPLAYIAGARWAGGNVSFYSSDRPRVFIEWNEKVAPWINMAELYEKGGIFVWEISANEKLPQDIRNTFPNLSTEKTLVLNYLRDETGRLQPIIIGYALLPPKN